MYSPIPMVSPKMAKAQMLAAEVRPKILSLVFIKAPAPRNPIPVTIADSKGIECSKPRATAITAKLQEPIATKVYVPKPIGL